jgi:hypothetical protein
MRNRYTRESRLDRRLPLMAAAISYSGSSYPLPVLVFAAVHHSEHNLNCRMMDGSAS